MTQIKHTSQNILGNDQGFTLTETMLALLIFTIGVLATIAMTISALDGFSRSRITSTEVNRTAGNIETLKELAYNDDNTFKGDGSSVTPMGGDGAYVSYKDTNNAVVAQTKLIIIDNIKLKSGATGGNFEMYYTKPLIER